MNASHRQSNGNHPMVSQLVKAFNASSMALDEAIEANDAAMIGEIDTELAALWNELVTLAPESKAETRELVAFLLRTLAPDAGASSVQSDAVDGILRLFDEHCREN